MKIKFRNETGSAFGPVSTFYVVCSTLYYCNGLYKFFFKKLKVYFITLQNLCEVPINILCYAVNVF